MSDIDYIPLSHKKSKIITKYNPYYTTYINEDIISTGIDTDDEDIIYRPIDNYIKKDLTKSITQRRAEYLENVKYSVLFFQFLLVGLFITTTVIFYDPLFCIISIVNLIGLYGTIKFNSNMLLSYVFISITQLLVVLTYVIVCFIFYWNILMFITTLTLIISYGLLIYKIIHFYYVLPKDRYNCIDNFFINRLF